ncbi:hypothetical protein BGZ73_006664 [Actinomortierella ambigua]|nr:hypothetical protein BGZ73_006664 [Actinomortierella ambigua]
MKVAYLLSVLVAAPLAHAGDYLVKFREGQVGTADFKTVSRIQQFNSEAQGNQRNQFDYSSKELSLTVMSLARATALSAKGGNGKSHAQIGVASAAGTASSPPSKEDDEDTIEIQSKGRWFTFDDHELHVWHGDFSEEEAAILASDGGVEMIEKDVEIRLADWSLPSRSRVVPNTEHLELTQEDLGQEMMQDFVDLERRKTAEVDEDDGEDDSDDHDKEHDRPVGIPGSGEDVSHRKPKKKTPSKKVALKRPSDFAKLEPSNINLKDVPSPDGTYMIQKNSPSWGLPRVSQRNLPLNADYFYPKQAGEGVDVYVIDTGINIHHVDFQGRARWGTNTVPGTPDTDENGHGTFVAGVVGSNTFGVAKKVNLIAVKGLNKEGTSTLSQILSALDWTIKTAARSSNRLNIVNLSLGAGYSRVLNSAVDTLVQSGLFITAAAGNGDAHNVGQDACKYSPASAPSAFTVGSTNVYDQMSSFSNYGSCVNMYAPGERVKSTWIGPTNREYYTDSGTSFAAPNVAGIAAIVMSAERGDRSDGAWSPRTLGNRVIQLGTRGVVKNFKGPSNTNLLGYNGVGIIGISNRKGDSGNGFTPRPDAGGNGQNNVPSASPSDNLNGPRFVSGLPIHGSSATNHVSTVSAFQTFTIVSTVSMTIISFIWSM